MIKSSAQAGQEHPQLANKLSRYREARLRRALCELSITAVLFLGFWLVAFVGVAYTHWLFAFLSAPAGVFLARLFLIQHDCGHGSFFPSRTWNDFVGRTIGIVTWTPYAYWRRLHALHHASSGNLDMRGKGDIDTLTVCEYLSKPLWRRLQYRLYRNPIVLFGLGPAYLFILKHRVPIELIRDTKDGWTSVMTTNAAIICLIIVPSIVVSPVAFAAVHLPATLCAATIGMWLFYVQHQFKDTRWDRHDEWNFRQHAIKGSSFYDLPDSLRWLTANVGIHHIHHLDSRIPSYRLYECLNDIPDLQKVNRLTIRHSLKCVSLALWDVSKQELVSFSTIQNRETVNK